jgi:hypothetical protein
VVRLRALAVATAVGINCLTSALGPSRVAAAEPGDEVVAYLDGKLIPIEQVSRFYCDDFSFPVIQCSRLAIVTDARAAIVSLLAGVDYVTIYDFTGFAGGFMHVSEDYTALLTIGWNDRISSIRGRNGETGKFWSDWFYLGPSWSFCCNANVSSLGSLNNTFSSVART